MKSLIEWDPVFASCVILLQVTRQCPGFIKHTLEWLGLPDLTPVPPPDLPGYSAWLSAGHPVQRTLVREMDFFFFFIILLELGIQRELLHIGVALF